MKSSAYETGGSTDGTSALKGKEERSERGRAKVWCLLLLLVPAQGYTDRAVLLLETTALLELQGGEVMEGSEQVLCILGRMVFKW